MNRSRFALVAVATIGLAGALAACDAGSGATTTDATPFVSASAATSSEFNDQDGTFATNMITHHRQAIEMAELAAGRSTDAKVLALAKRIEAAQEPEIQMMSGWLDGWGMPMPSDRSGMEMGNQMPGMMSTADMTRLRGRKGADFDQMFLTMMITHHQGAITMARTEVASGMNPQAKAKAEQVISDQTAEIAAMRSMLG